jgi:CxxC-x17-CxxC domain-containing protein
MEFTDKDLSCVECGSSFVFSAGEQERHNQLGFTNEPKRCAPCRAAKKAARGGGGGGGGGGGYGGGGGGGGGPREMHPVVCAQCGQDTQVPFKPRGDRPVYCSDCFSQQR